MRYADRQETGDADADRGAVEGGVFRGALGEDAPCGVDQRREDYE